MTSLLVMVPVRNRPEKIPGLIESYEKNTTRDDTELMFISDGDDDSYQDTDWGSHVHAVLDPREYVVGKMNKTAMSCVDAYDAIMFAQDDNLFVTHGWDDIMLSVLEGMGGTGMLYPDDKRRQDIPEIIMISTDIITELGWFACPQLNHYYTDHVWSDLGRGAGLLRFVPETVVEHNHYSVSADTPYDGLYHEMEDKFGTADREAYLQWRATLMPFQVSQLRRKFNKDVRWLLEKVLCGTHHGRGNSPFRDDRDAPVPRPAVLLQCHLLQPVCGHRLGGYQHGGDRSERDAVPFGPDELRVVHRIQGRDVLRHHRKHRG